ncbi:hypothetical protein M758_9G061900 [Ceratodon purpureus]|nr:hypothetical protein M758_9G061900 [Ceratodon purpureus]
MADVGSRLWRRALCFSLAASDGYGHGPDDPGAGCGGVMTLLHPRWHQHIGASGSILNNRAHWLILKGLPGGDIGLVNLYAPNDSPTRCLLWETLARDLPDTCRWMLLGDFNMVEGRSDKTRQCSALIPARERLLFDAMKVALNVHDNPRSAGSLKYSWDNNRDQEARVLARLDRLYLFHATARDPHRSLLQYSIKGNLTRSDHHPVFATLQLADSPPRRSHWKMSNQWLDAASPEIHRIWSNAGPNTSFFSKMYQVTKFYRGFCKQRASTFREDEDALRQELEAATSLAQVQPTDDGVLHRRGECRARLEALQLRQLAGRKTRSRIRWKHRGDHVSREFFSAVKERHNTGVITALHDPQGQRVTDRQGLEDIALNYYRDLYAAPIPTEAHRAAEEALLALIPASFRETFPASVLAALGRPPDAAELEEALKAMAVGKSPGPDGISTEFFKQFWVLIGPEFTAMLNRAITNGAFPTGLHHGLIVLLQKEGNLELITNKRPITLLNTSYKIFAKMLQIRLQRLLPDVIHDGQSAFIPGRYILDSVMVQHETIDWARRSDQALVMLKLDFRKAYDSVTWSFLFKAMDRMGLPAPFTAMVRLLLVDASASVAINGACSASFPIRRGVRQGCPLAPYLFLLVAEALATASRHAISTGHLKGITLPDGATQQFLSQYAYDATFSLLGTARSLTTASTLLTDFGLATGLELNRTKCALYWFGPGPPPAWLSLFGCSVAAPHSLSRLLGTPFGVSLHTGDVDAFLTAKITRKLRYWASIHLSLAGRVVIANSVMLSTLWYFLSIWGGSKTVLNSIRASIRNYVWSGTAENARVRVSWTDCCAPKSSGGLGLIDPAEALASLMTKWILRALEPGRSALHLLLRHRLAKLQPPGPGRWPRTLHWTLTSGFRAPRGSHFVGSTHQWLAGHRAICRRHSTLHLRGGTERKLMVDHNIRRSTLWIYGTQGPDSAPCRPPSATPPLGRRFDDSPPLAHAEDPVPPSRG